MPRSACGKRHARDRPARAEQNAAAGAVRSMRPVSVRLNSPCVRLHKADAPLTRRHAWKGHHHRQRTGRHSRQARPGRCQYGGLQPRHARPMVLHGGQKDEGRHLSRRPAGDHRVGEARLPVWRHDQPDAESRADSSPMARSTCSSCRGASPISTDTRAIG